MDLSKRILCAVLAFALFMQPIATFPLSSTASAQDQPETDASVRMGTRLLRSGEELHRAVETLIRRAKHPDTPGTSGGIPSASEARAIDQRVRSWKNEVQRALSLPSLPTGSASSAGDFLDLEFKLAAAETYLNLVTQLITLRIAMDLPYGEQWRDQFVLELGDEALEELPGLFTDESDRTGDRYFSLVVERTGGRSRLRLSESLVHGIELGAMAARPNDASFLTMVQYLAVRQLLQNLSDLKYLKRDRAIRWPSIPSRLTERLPTLANSAVLLEEQQLAAVEPALRSLLVQSYSTISSEIPRTVDRALSRDIARALLDLNTDSSDPDVDRLAGLLQSELQQGEGWNFEQGLESAVNSASRLFSKVQGEERLQLLRQVIGNTKETAVIKTLIFLAAKRAIQLNPERARRISALLRVRRGALQQGLDDSVLQRWVSNAESRLDGLLYANRRMEFLESLFVESRVLNLLYGDGVRNETVDLSILSRSFDEKIHLMEPREEMRAWVSEIASAPSYAEARDRYARIILRETYPVAVRDGIVDPGLVKLYADAAELRPNIPDFDSLDQDFRDFIVGRVELSRRKNLRDIIKYGEWMGFHVRPSVDSPKVEQVLKTREDRDAYARTLREAIKTDYPILGQEVMAPNPNHGKVEWECSDGPGGSSRCRNIHEHEPREVRQPLFKVLSRLNPHDVSSAEIAENAQPYVDVALESVEANIHRNIRDAAEASDLRELEAVVRSSLMIQLVMSVSPEFRRMREAFVEQIMNPTLLDSIMREDVGLKVTIGFAALGLIQLTRWVVRPARPFIDTGMKAFSPFIRGFTKAATAVMVAETAYEYHHLRHKSELDEDVQSLFGSSVEGGGFFHSGEAAAFHDEFTSAKWWFYGRLVLDTAFFYLPEGKRLVNKLGQIVRRRELVEDLRAFRALQLEPGKWNKLDRALQRLRRRAQAGKVTQDALSDAERAHARLRAKKRAGRHWSLPREIDPEQLTPREREIHDLLNRRGHFE